jgi:hypothetical protein
MEEFMMRKSLLIILFFYFFGNIIQAQTNGSLSVSVTTTSTGGNYAPRNIIAIWIEDSSGKFVKTLLAYANTRKTHLNTWEASTTTAGSAFNSVDAITSATQSSHATRTCSWNGTDFNGKLMADADYKLRMELTDKNATGNVASFTFTKGPNTQKLSPASVPSFASISINWTTSVTGINPDANQSNTFVVYPNPGTGQFTILGENIKSLKVTDLSGKEISKSQSPVVDLTTQPKGIYLITIKTDQETVVRKIIKK